MWPGSSHSVQGSSRLPPITPLSIVLSQWTSSSSGGLLSMPGGIPGLLTGEWIVSQKFSVCKGSIDAIKCPIQLGIGSHKKGSLRKKKSKFHFLCNPRMSRAGWNDWQPVSPWVQTHPTMALPYAAERVNHWALLFSSSREEFKTIIWTSHNTAQQAQQVWPPTVCPQSRSEATSVSISHLIPALGLGCKLCLWVMSFKPGMELVLAGDRTHKFGLISATDNYWAGPDRATEESLFWLGTSGSWPHTITAHQPKGRPHRIKSLNIYDTISSQTPPGGTEATGS